jgi:hypothetical protein
MRGVRRQAQRVNAFPYSNADSWRIDIGALFGKLEASFFGTLMFFVSKAFRCGLRQVGYAWRRHVSISQLSSDVVRLGGRHLIGRDPAPR